MGTDFGARATLDVGGRRYEIFRLPALQEGGRDILRLPYAIRVLLENQLRQHADGLAEEADVLALADWDPAVTRAEEIAFMPARVLLQDFTGVPALVDLAAMRDAMASLEGDPARINPLIPADLVVDHSVQVDTFGVHEALALNTAREYQRNRERYEFLKWAQQAFKNVRVVPPGMGICHQVNLEVLGRVVFTSDDNPRTAGLPQPRAYPDTLVGTDSHTTMINGLGVLGWGVGGIEAEAAMLGQPVSMLVPSVLGVRLHGRLRPGATATDLVLAVTELLRTHGVVGKFVEFLGPGLGELGVADRATIANMCPEYGATCAFFPVDDETLRYLRLTGRPPEHVALIEAYAREQTLFRTPDAPEPTYSELLTLDLGAVEPSVAGPRRPQDRVPLSEVAASFRQVLPSLRVGSHGAETWGEQRSPEATHASPPINSDEASVLRHGSIVLAAITSCTNTSNPSVMLAAGLLARRAVEAGLVRKPWVKTSLAPGSRAVTAYLEAAELAPYLEKLGFHVVGYGCTTCIGNSGPLAEEIAAEIAARGLVVCSVLSGNRNFEGRIHSEVRANYLASPPLVVAYALAGRIDIDLTTEPLGVGANGRPVYLRDLWPTRHEVLHLAQQVVHPEVFRAAVTRVFQGDDAWRALAAPTGELFAWAPESAYVRQPPYFLGVDRAVPDGAPDITGARVLAVLGDSITTDHISPAGSIRADSPAGLHLQELGVRPDDFNSYGSRRGNHDVMVRGTFANVRLRNAMAPGREGGFTRHVPSDEVMPIYDAAVRYRADGVPLVVFAGRDYGAGSSRDWAAKGVQLLGVRAVIAESFERIHRSNLVGMGVLPLQFRPGESAASLGLTGEETVDITGIEALAATGTLVGAEVTVRATRADGRELSFAVRVRIDTPQEALYDRHGGVLPFVLRELAAGRETPETASRGLAAAPPESLEAFPNAVEEGSLGSFPASDPPAY